MTATGSIVIKEKGISSTLNWKVSGLDNGVHLTGPQDISFQPSGWMKE